MSLLQMPEPLVSVVVPAYNRQDCVGRALSSIQGQTYENWEALVVDDGSRDGTHDAVEELARLDPRIRLIRHEKNRGAQAARNTGINVARGEWVAFLDSDDTWLPHSIAARIRVAQRENVSVVHSGGDILHEDGIVKPYFVPPMAGRVYAELLLREGPLFQALLIARDALRRVGGLDERIVAFQEWDTALTLAKRYAFAFVPVSTFVYDCRRSDSMSKNYLRAGIGYERVFHKRYVDILRIGGPGAMADHYRRAGKWYQAAAADRAMRRCSLMAWLWSSIDARSALHRIREALSRSA